MRGIFRLFFQEKRTKKDSREKNEEDNRFRVNVYI